MWRPAKASRHVGLVQALTVFALRTVSRACGAIVALDVVAFRAPVIIVIDLAISFTFRVPRRFLSHGVQLSKVPAKDLTRWDQDSMLGLA